jgi:hypothetical protein
MRLAAEILLVAALLGRSAPQPAAGPAPRHPAHPRYLGTEGAYVGDFPGEPPVLLDTETGALVPCPVPGARRVGMLGCSPWRDGAGQFHLAGVVRDDASGAFALVRSTFPAGRVLDRVKTEVVPSRQPCWFPDGSDRILFAGGDCRLYVLEFSRAGRSRDPDPPAPREVRWQAAKPGVGEIQLRDPCWPSSPSLGGRLIVNLTCLENASPQAWRSELWWLQLSPDGDAIVGAERAIERDSPDKGQGQISPREFLPRVGMMKNDTPLLAYMVENEYQGPLELWVSPIAPTAPGNGPCVLRWEGRKLAENCACVAPAFSADGRWVYAWRWVDRKLRPERLAVPIMADGPRATGSGEA